MRWFHVKLCVKKYKSLEPDFLFKEIVSDIYDFHYCINEVFFNSLKRGILKSWEKNDTLVEFDESSNNH